MKIFKKILLIMVCFIVFFSITGCNSVTKNFGGNLTINLPENTKLELITWKESSLWYLTRPMREDDIAETHTYQQQSEWGVFEGTITIIETKTK